MNQVASLWASLPSDSPQEFCEGLLPLPARLQIRATADLDRLIALCRRVPQLLENPPELHIDCGDFSCNTLEELKEVIRQAIEDTPPKPF